MPDKEITAGGRDIRVRGLTRREVKQLRGKGLDPGHITAAFAEETMDAVMDMVLEKDDLDFLEDQVNAESLKVFRRILDLTFGKADAVKNS